MVVFTGLTLSRIHLAFNPSLTFYTIGCLSIVIFAGIGNDTVFKLVAMYFSKQAGIVNGIVSAMGGLTGIYPRMMLSILYHLKGITRLDLWRCHNWLLLT